MAAARATIVPAAASTHGNFFFSHDAEGFIFFINNTRKNGSDGGVGNAGPKPTVRDIGARDVRPGSLATKCT